MIEATRRVGLFALYQTTVLLGILLLPLALAARRVGLTLPLDRVVEPLGEAYDRTRRAGR